jgi:hypothetical protein
MRGCRFTSEAAAATAHKALCDLMELAATSSGALESELHGEVFKAAYPSCKLFNSHGPVPVSVAWAGDIFAFSTEDVVAQMSACPPVTDSFAVGDLVDHFHKGVEMWVPAHVEEVSQKEGKVRIVHEDVVMTKSVATWVPISSRMLTRRGAHTKAEDAILRDEPWRSALKPGDRVDLLGSGARFSSGEIIECSSLVECPDSAVVMTKNPLVGDESNDASSEAAVVVTDDSGAEHAAAPPDSKTRWVRAVSVAALDSATIRSNAGWMPVHTLRIAAWHSESEGQTSFGIGMMSASDASARVILLPSGVPLTDDTDSVIGDDSVAAALKATPDAAILVRGPDRSDGGFLAASLLRSFVRAGGVTRVLQRCAAAKRSEEEVAAMSTHKDERMSRFASLLSSSKFGASPFVAKAMEAGHGDLFEGAASLVSSILGAPAEADAGPEQLPSIQTLCGIAAIFDRGVVLPNRHWAKHVFPAMALLFCRTVCCYSQALRRRVQLEHLIRLGGLLRNLLWRAMDKPAAVELLETCTMEIAPGLLLQDLLQQRISGMKLIVSTASAVGKTEAHILDKEGLASWLDEIELFDIVFTRSRSHVELYRRVGGVIGALFSAGIEAEAHVQRLWESGTNARADDETRQLCFEQIQDMAWELTPSTTAALLCNIASMPRPSLSVQLIRLAVSLLSVAADKAQQVGPIGLNLLWSIAYEPGVKIRRVLFEVAKPPPPPPRAKDGEPPSGEAVAEYHRAADAWREADVREALRAAEESMELTSEEAVDAPLEARREAEEQLLTLLKQFSQERMRLPFCVRAIQCLGRRHHGTRMLTLLWGIISDFPASKAKPIDMTRSELLLQLNSEWDLLRVILNDVEELHREAKANAVTQGWVTADGMGHLTLAERRAVGSLVCASKPKGEDSTDFLTALRERLVTLVKACEACEGLELSKESAMQLWELLVVDTLGPQETEILCRQLKNAATGSWSAVSALLSQETMVALFTDAMLKGDPRGMQLPDLGAVTSYFLLANGRTGSLELRRAHSPGSDPEFTVRKAPSTMTGFDFLWRVALEAEDDEVGSRAVQFLSLLHSQFSPGFEAESGGLHPAELRSKFVSSLVERLRAGIKSANWSMASRCLVAVDQLLKEAEEACVSDSSMRPHSGLSVHDGAMRIKFSNDISKGLFVGGDAAEVVSTKAFPGKLFTLEFPGLCTVGEARSAVAEHLGIPVVSIELSIKGTVVAASKNGMSLTSLDLKPSDIVTLNIRQMVPQRAPLLANPNVSDSTQAVLTPAAERVVTHVFSRFSSHGALDYNGFREFCRGAGVTDQRNLGDDRLKDVYSRFDCDAAGHLTLKGFLQFYTEASLSRATNVYSDLEKLGYDVSTMTFPSDGDSEGAAATSSRSTEEARRMRAMEVRALSKRVLISAESGLYDALFDALQAPPAFDDTVVKRAWDLLMALPTIPGVIRSIGGGAESHLFIPATAVLVEDAKPDKGKGGDPAAAADAAAAGAKEEEEPVALAAVASGEGSPDSPTTLTKVDLSAVDWTRELDASSPFRLLYHLQLLNMFAVEAEPVKPQPAPPSQSKNSGPSPGSSEFIGPLSPEQYAALEGGGGDAAEPSNDPQGPSSQPEESKPAAVEERKESERFAVWREQFVRTGGVGRLLNLLMVWDADSIAAVERSTDSAAAQSTADTLRRQCVASLLSLARLFVGPSLQANVGVEGSPSTGAGADDSATSLDDPGSSPSNGGADPKDDESAPITGAPCSAASAIALVGQLRGELGESVLASMDTFELLVQAFRMSQAAGAAGTTADVDIVTHGLGLASALSIQRPALLARLLREEGGETGWFPSLITSLLLHQSSDASIRIRRLASSNFGTMVSSIPDAALVSAGGPLLGDFMLDLSLARLDEVAEAAEKAVTSAGTKKDTREGESKSTGGAAAVCVQYFSLLTRVLRHIAGLHGGLKAPAKLSDVASAEVAVAASPPSSPAHHRDLESRLMPVALSLMKRVASHSPLERREGPEQEDQLLNGVLKTLATLAQALPELRNVAVTPGTGVPTDAEDTFLRVVFEDCLFFQPQVAEDLDETLGPNLPKCKRPRTRAAGFTLLSALAENAPGNIGKLADSILPVLDAVKGDAPTSAAVDAKYSRRAPSGYVGLLNLGCICYMNSMLQQVYMVPHFRFGLMNVDVPVTDDDDEDGGRTVPNDVTEAVTLWRKSGARDGDTLKGEDETAILTPASESVLYQLQRMFASLSMSMRRDYNPRRWCNAFKDSSGNPVKIGQQQDAEEFLNQLLDRLEQALKGTSQEALVRDCFTGTTVDQMCCPEFDWIRERRTVFHHLPLEVTNNSNVYEALGKSIRGDIISDYRCEVDSSRGTDLHKRQLLGHLPETLMLHFKRMVFDFDTFLNKKVNTRFEFPMELDLYAFTREGVLEEEQLAAATTGGSPFLSAILKTDGAAAGAAASSTEERKRYEDGRLVAPNDDYVYDLAGVVVHTGTAQSGHYYSFIRDRATGSWFEFNDSSVTPFNPEDIPDKCFGGTGTTTATSSYGYREKVETERTLNAYLTVYERRKPSIVKQAVTVTAVMQGVEHEPVVADARPFDPLARREEIHAVTESVKDAEERAAKAAQMTAKDEQAVLNATAFANKLMSLAHRMKEEAMKRDGATSIEGVKVAPVSLLRELLPPRQFSRVFKDNSRFLRQQELYAGEFFGFLARMYQSAAPAMVACLRDKPAAGSDALMTTHEAQQLLLTGTDFALRVMVKGKDGKQVASMTEALATVYAESTSQCSSLLNRLAADPDWMRELLLLCSSQQTRKAVLQLMTIAMSRVAAAEPGALWRAEREAVAAADAAKSEADAKASVAAGKKPDAPVAPVAPVAPATTEGGAPDSPSTLWRFLNAHLSLLPKVDGAWPRFDEWWQLLVNATDIEGEDVKRWLIHKQMLLVLFDFVLGDRSPVKDRVRPDGRKIATMGSTYKSANWDPMFDLWSRLVQACQLPPHTRIGEGALGSIARFIRKRAAPSTVSPWLSVPPGPDPASFVKLPLLPNGESDEDAFHASLALAESGESLSQGDAAFPDQPLLEYPQPLTMALSLGVKSEYVAKMAEALAWENPEFSETFAADIVGSLPGLVSVERRRLAFFEIVDLLLAIQDSYQERRVHLLIGDPFHRSVRKGMVYGFPRTDAPAPDKSDTSATARHVSGSITRDFLYSVTTGASGGVLGWVVKSLRHDTSQCQALLTWLLDKCNDIPAVAKWIIKQLPPVSPLRHRSMGDWIIEASQWIAHTATASSRLPTLEDRVKAVQLLGRARDEVARHCAALDVPHTPLSAEARTEEERILGWKQHLCAAKSGFSLSSGSWKLDDGTTVMGFRFTSSQPMGLKITMTLLPTPSKRDNPPNFVIHQVEDDEGKEGEASILKPEEIKWSIGPFQCGVLFSRPLIDQSRDFGSYDFNWSYGEVFVADLPAFLATTRTDPSPEFPLLEDAGGFVMDPDEAELLETTSKLTYMVSRTLGSSSGSGGGSSSRGNDTTWQEQESHRDPAERIFSDDMTIDPAMAALMFSMIPYAGGGENGVATKACPYCFQEFPANELRCKHCNKYVGSGGSG